MNRRTMGLGLLVGLSVAVSALSGCSDSDGQAEERGTLSVPLTTEGPSGTKYRLRDAVFEIRRRYVYEYPSSVGGEGGSGTTPSVTILSSETDPDASSLQVSLERDYYYVTLRPGWRMEKVEGEVATTVPATLLSSETEWVYVGAHSTSWVEYQFGIGGRALWFNGKLNVSIGIYEKPSDLYGDSGAPAMGVAGAGGEAGAPTGVGGSW